MPVKKKENKPKRGFFKGCLDFVLFIGWIVGTGIGGYFFGVSQKQETIRTLVPINCPKPEPIIQPREQVLTTPTELDCTTYLTTSGLGSDYEYLKKSWTCSRAKYNTTLHHEINNINIDKTKWKNVLSIDPDEFFNRYLAQYPSDMVITQPVVIFSHAPVQTLQDVAEKCTVLDVAIVPDRPGICVAVTETYHDVASYHMLHAQQDPSTGSLTLSSNPIRGRNIPTERSYSIARVLLMEYFTFSSAVTGAVKGLIVKNGNEKVTVFACLVEHKAEVELFRNSLKTYLDQGGLKEHIFSVSRHPAYSKELKSLGIKSVYASKATSVGKDLAPHLSKGFLQIWFAFAAAEVGAEVVWISPSTIWRVKPSTLMMSLTKDVETAWMFNGRRDPRAAPFFVSTDFFYVRGGGDRPIHLFHEILVHADLLIEWDDMNALAAYRLTENNARYGTISHIFPPYVVLNTHMLGNKVDSIKESLQSSEAPQVVVIPSDLVPMTSYDDIEVSTNKKIQMLKEIGLWFI